MYLNTHSYYSLKFGEIAPEVLLQLVFQHNITAMALTDINSTSANLDFVRLASKYNIKSILSVVIVFSLNFLIIRCHIGIYQKMAILLQAII